jgi:hypothetical protein
MTTSPILIKWQMKISNIESKYSIEELRCNYINFRTANRKKITPNRFSQSQYNLYNSYLKTKLKIAKFQKSHQTSPNPSAHAAKEVTNTITPEDSRAIAKHQQKSHQTTSNSSSRRKEVPKVMINTPTASGNYSQIRKFISTEPANYSCSISKICHSTIHHTSNTHSSTTNSFNDSMNQTSPNASHSIASDNDSVPDFRPSVQPRSLEEDLYSVASSSTTNDLSNDDEHNDDDIDCTIVCDNCFRQNNRILINKYGSFFYKMRFVQTTRDMIVQRRSFRNVQHSRSSNDEVIDLCEQCSNYLIRIATNDDDEPNRIKENEKNAKSQKNIWPAFIWSLLNNRNIHQKYGAQIWCFIPSQWRYWWIDSLKDNVYRVFDNITLTSPKSIFIDRSNAIKEWDADIASYMLSRLASTCNKHILPNILCPWGCTEFNHCCGTIGIDLIFQRFLPKAIIAFEDRLFPNQ